MIMTDKSVVIYNIKFDLFAVICHIMFKPSRLSFKTTDVLLLGSVKNLQQLPLPCLLTVTPV